MLSKFTLCVHLIVLCCYSNFWLLFWQKFKKNKFKNVMIYDWNDRKRNLNKKVNMKEKDGWRIIMVKDIDGKEKENGGGIEQEWRKNAMDNRKMWVSAACKALVSQHCPKDRADIEVYQNQKHRRLTGFRGGHAVKCRALKWKLLQVISFWLHIIDELQSTALLHIS